MKHHDMKPYMRKQRFNDRIKLKTGTFLHTYCPHCSQNLIKDNMIQLTGVSEDDQEFILELSPYLNVFEHRSTMDIQPQSVLKDMRCPFCRQSIVDSDVTCGDCNEKTAYLSVSAAHIRVPFYICLREGCHWHGVTPEDEQKLIKDDSDEW